jgi:hypothetical protein
MDPELKKKWVEALRSGKYEQTKECLHNDDGYCCLGVLADIKGVEWKREVGEELGEKTFVFYEEEYDTTKQFDTGIPNYWINVPSVENHLVHMNDGSLYHEIESKTFAEIADYIENSVDI